MNKRVEEFLANSKQSEDRASILIEAGLYDKVYMPESEDGSSNLDETSDYDYPESEYDSAKHKTVYYRKQPIEVTDEEFEVIKQHIQLGKSNALASIITFCAYMILALGCIAGCIAGNGLADYSSNFNMFWALIVWGIGAVSCISMLWFAEVLKLLQDIKNQLQ